MEVKNAKIRNAWIGIEDHGIMTSMIDVDYGGSGQGFGGYDLRGERMYQWVDGVTRAVGVERWDDLVGKVVRVQTDGLIRGISGPLENSEWFTPGEVWT